ncbi:metalloregulator ArsR/SmtB family transcription factor [Arenibacter sp. F20364]|uniref:ArsR/SmtB family transcription factor n=1 Tax=Arenibacter sp. F20364 TaxID=2926415 RepID=UPI001FF1CC41|nr:metalloregulator ArsR/SmtB family transcription factor [Arenibacter sp. F20364]MCK0192724.1 helix-turn-helix domain-containing protein [Arenibacter sp. F20364]
MDIEDKFGYIATLLGDKARAIMLWSLLDGKAYTATELAICANISKQSASNHLAKLLEAQLLAVEKQGRHRYYRLANPRVAQVIESMASLIPDSQIKSINTKPKSQNIVYARTCYDHLAGELGVKITSALIKNNILTQNDNKYIVTTYGLKWFSALNINIAELKLKKRSFAHKCLDWTERRHHLAGSLGAALLEYMICNDWIRKKNNTREVLITSLGIKELNDKLELFRK